MPADTLKTPRAARPCAASTQTSPLSPNDAQRPQRLLFLAGLEQIIAEQTASAARSRDLAEQARARGDLDTAGRLLALAEQSAEIAEKARSAAAAVSPA